MKRITVLLADDHKVVREGFRKLLELEGDLEVVGEAADGREAVAAVKSLRPEVVLMDIAMPRLNGLEATRRVIKARPVTRVMILSAHNDDAYVESAIGSGAAGFLLKQSSAHEVCRAIREVHAGKTYFSPVILSRLNRLHAPSADRTVASGRRAARVTERGMEVLQLVAEGNANKQIAERLGLSIKTIEKHRQILMQNLDIHDTAGLTRYAISAGIIENSAQATVLAEADPGGSPPAARGPREKIRTSAKQPASPDTLPQ